MDRTAEKVVIIASLLVLLPLLSFADSSDSGKRLVFLPPVVSDGLDREEFYRQLPLRLKDQVQPPGSGTGDVDLSLASSPSLTEPEELEEFLNQYPERQDVESQPRSFALLIRPFQATISRKPDTIVAETGVELWLLETEESRLLLHAELKGLGLGDTEEGGVRRAEEELFQQLLLYLRRIDLLGLGGPIVSIDGDRLLLRIGAEDGVRRGDELEAASGALVRIKESGPDYAFAELVYGDPGLDESLRSLDRLGIEVQGYVKGVLSSDLELYTILGAKLAPLRGVGNFRPFGGFELPLQTLSDHRGAHLFPYAGVEYLWRRGRWKVIPGGAFGVGFPLDRRVDDGRGATYFGGFGSCEISLLFHRDWRCAFTGGYGYWIGTNLLEEEGRYSYNGVIAGLGLVWKL